jgi:predicted HNH restriction endonuclease
MSVKFDSFALRIHKFMIMARKINILTCLIFIYSIVVCLTCKRDFSQNYGKADQESHLEMVAKKIKVNPIVAANQLTKASILAKN